MQLKMAWQTSSLPWNPRRSVIDFALVWFKNKLFQEALWFPFLGIGAGRYPASAARRACGMEDGSVYPAASPGPIPHLSRGEGRPGSRVLAGMPPTCSARNIREVQAAGGLRPRRKGQGSGFYEEAGGSPLGPGGESDVWDPE